MAVLTFHPAIDSAPLRGAARPGKPGLAIDSAPLRAARSGKPGLAIDSAPLRGAARPGKLGLAIASVLVLGACYEPEFRDCVVACADDSDCGPGHVCSADRLCMAPGASDRCERPVIDAGVPRDVAMPPEPRDAREMPDPPPDAPPAYPLLVKVEGQGRVELPGRAPCSDECTYVVAGPVQLEAIAGDERRLDDWDGDCDGTVGAICLLVVTRPMMAVAKFRKLDD